MHSLRGVIGVANVTVAVRHHSDTAHARPRVRGARSATGRGRARFTPVVGTPSGTRLG